MILSIFKIIIMDYAQKNKGFATSHKLQALERCGFCFRKEYIDMIPNPTREKEPDYFTVGSAMDYLMTEGPDKYLEKYKTVKIRSKKEKELAEANKQILLTETMGKLINNMNVEHYDNKLFSDSFLKKKIFELEIQGVKVRSELDDYDEDREYFTDLKTTADIMKFNPHDYIFQMAFYYLVVKEDTGKEKTARLEVVDKYAHFSRSRCYEYSIQTLQAEIPRIESLLDYYKQCFEKNEFKADQEPTVVERCPYYGFDGHGRRKDIIVV